MSYIPSLKISYCTACMDRVDHLKVTLPKNIASAKKDLESLDNVGVEFVVVNYGQYNRANELESWIKDRFPQEIENGMLRYVRLAEPQYFHMSHSKNVSHNCATGNVLCNVDADNCINDGFTTFIANEYKRSGEKIFMRPSTIQRVLRQKPTPVQGSGGRIIISSKTFHEINGYDEINFNGWGKEDSDFATRVFKKIYKPPIDVPDRFLENGIIHGDELRSLLYDDKGKEISIKNLSKTFLSCAGKIVKLKDFIESKTNSFLNYGVNADGYGKGQVSINFSQETEEAYTKVLSRPI